MFRVVDVASLWNLSIFVALPPPPPNYCLRYSSCFYNCMASVSLESFSQCRIFHLIPESKSNLRMRIYFLFWGKGIAGILCNTRQSRSTKISLTVRLSCHPPPLVGHHAHRRMTQRYYTVHEFKTSVSTKVMKKDTRTSMQTNVLTKTQFIG